LNAASPDGLSGSETAADKAARVVTLNLQWQQLSWLILLDFADYLAAYLPEVWASITGSSGSRALTPQEQALLDQLGSAVMPAGPTPAMQGSGVSKPAWPSLREALHNIGASRSSLEQATQLYNSATVSTSDNPWPDHHFLLAGLDTTRSVV